MGHPWDEWQGQFLLSWAPEGQRHMRARITSLRVEGKQTMDMAMGFRLSKQMTAIADALALNLAEDLLAAFGRPKATTSGNDVPDQEAWEDEIPRFSGGIEGLDFWTFSKEWKEFAAQSGLPKADLLHILVTRPLEGTIKSVCQNMRTKREVFKQLNHFYGKPGDCGQDITIQERQLSKAFLRFGNKKQVMLIPTKYGTTRGYRFIIFSSAEEVSRRKSQPLSTDVSLLLSPLSSPARPVRIAPRQLVVWCAPRQDRDWRQSVVKPGAKPRRQSRARTSSTRTRQSVSSPGDGKRCSFSPGMGRRSQRGPMSQGSHPRTTQKTAARRGARCLLAIHRGRGVGKLKPLWPVTWGRTIDAATGCCICPPGSTR